MKMASARKDLNISIQQLKVAYLCRQFQNLCLSNELSSEYKIPQFKKPKQEKRKHEDSAEDQNMGNQCFKKKKLEIPIPAILLAHSIKQLKVASLCRQFQNLRLSNELSSEYKIPQFKKPKQEKRKHKDSAEDQYMGNQCFKLKKSEMTVTAILLAHSEVQTKYKRKCVDSEGNDADHKILKQ